MGMRGMLGMYHPGIWEEDTLYIHPGIWEEDTLYIHHPGMGGWYSLLVYLLPYTPGYTAHTSGQHQHCCTCGQWQRVKRRGPGLKTENS